MAIKDVKNYFKSFNMESRIIEFDSSSATVSLAAKALNTKEENIAKTLSFKLKSSIIIIVTAGNTKINNSKYKSFFKEKARMLSTDDVLKYIGHEIGGVCPFCINEDINIYLDESLKTHKTIFPACGSSNSAIELSIEELEKYSNYKSWIDVCDIKKDS